MRTIVLYSMKTGVTFCPKCKLDMTGKGLRPRSRGLKPPMAAPTNYDSNDSIRAPRKEKERTGVLHDRKQHAEITPKHHGAQCYYVLCKKAGIPERKCKSLSSENGFGKRSDQQSGKDGLFGPLGNRSDSVNYYKKSKHKQKRELKSLNKQNKMIFSMAKKSGLRREIKNIKGKYSEKRSYSSSDSSISDSGSGSSLSSDSER